MYHAVSFNFTFYSVNNANSAASEADSVLTWVPAGCTATQLSVFSRQSNTINVTLRQGTPGSMADTALGVLGGVGVVVHGDGECGGCGGEFCGLQRVGGEWDGGGGLDGVGV